MYSTTHLRIVTNCFSGAGGAVKFFHAISCLKKFSEAEIFVAVLIILCRLRCCKCETCFYWQELLSGNDFGRILSKNLMYGNSFQRVTKQFLRANFFGPAGGLSFVARPIREKFYYRSDYGRNLRVIYSVSDCSRLLSNILTEKYFLLQCL